MAIENHIIETICAASYRVYVYTRIVVDGADLGQGHRVEAQSLATGKRWLVDTVTIHEGLVAMAEKLGFDLRLEAITSR